MLLRFVASTLSLIATVYGHSTGVDTCESAPQHGTWAQGCNPTTCSSTGGAVLNMPFAILAFDSNNMPITSYMANTNYNIILSSTNVSTHYKGFIFNVGLGNINGNFAVVSAAASGAGNLTLNPIDATSRQMTGCTNGVTHVNNMNKLTNTFLWRSPPAGSRSVTFKSVIVTSRTSVNYVVSLRLNEMNTNPTVSSMLTTSPIPATCSIPYTSLTGLSGVTPSYVISTSGSTSVLGGTSPTCLSGTGTSSGAKLAFMIDLGVDTILGSQLTVDTCLTAIGDTVLYVGTGCPTSSTTFRCLMVNDDAGSTICPSDSMASQVRLNATSRYIWAVVGNYASSTTASSGIRWWYGSATPPSVANVTIVSTGSVMPTPTMLTSTSGTPRASRSPTMSNSITHSATATMSMGLMPSATSTSTSSIMPSVSSSFSETPSSSPSMSRSGTESSMETASKSMPPSPPRTVSSSASSTHTPIETDTPTSISSPTSSSTSSSTSVSTLSSTSSSTSVSTLSSTSSSTSVSTVSSTSTATSRYIAMPVIAPADKPSIQNNYGMIGMGVGLGVIVTIAVIGGYYVIHKKNKKMQKPLSMRNIVYLGDKGQYVSENPMSSQNLTEETVTLSPTTFRYSKNVMESPNKQVFEPMSIRPDNL